MNFGVQNSYGVKNQKAEVESNEESLMGNLSLKFLNPSTKPFGTDQFYHD